MPTCCRSFPVNRNPHLHQQCHQTTCTTTNTDPKIVCHPPRSRKRRRNRIVVAVVVSSIAVLAFLPILNHQSGATTPLSPPPATPPAVAALDVIINGVDSDHTSSATAVVPAAMSAKIPKGGGNRGRGNGDRGGRSGSAGSADHAGSGGLERSKSPQQIIEGDEASRTQESGGGQNEDPIGDPVGGVTLERGGGKLKDGRDRCFMDSEGFHRCYPNVFFVGTSKCGRLFFHCSCFRGRRLSRCWCCWWVFVGLLRA